ncbi:carbohydrate-binding protein [Catelliglobosispora koreensis]|uniref:carbohydrate-binding protein n=1 Tax=Catelliglobosispora koreensis TaxID=129052 RepID=UPI0003608A38|nr:carbohydrate-binding protein [Catelliglobosispora koreensis]
MSKFFSAIASAAMTATAVVAITVATPAAPAVALDNGLARTPPMGFNNWNATHCDADFNEAMILGVIDIFVNQGLRDVGYQYVNLDDCWAVPAPNSRDAQGNLKPDLTRFPRGIKYLADYAHARGLKLGIYTSAGTKTCNTIGFSGGLGNEVKDANLFASWGIDYLKYDNCNNQGVDARQRYGAMRDALAATGRPIVYSICEWGRTGPPRVWEWGKEYGNLWRTTGDISDNWTSMIGKAQANRVLAQYAGPGHWNDPDMLEVGNGGMTATEYRTHFSLWAIMAAPLLIGSDLRSVNADTFTILKNTDVIAVDQDPLGRQGTVISSNAGLVVYAKTLANGDRAVALSNETTSTATMGTSTSAIGLGGSSSYTLKDLWSKAVSTTSGNISASVPGHGTVMYRVSRAGTSVRHESEAATTSAGSTVDTNWSGYSGTGFLNTANAVGSYVQFTVNAAQAGPATLTFDYANGTTADRPSTLSVNGGSNGTLAFPATGAWSLWKTQTVNVNLNAGVNTVRLTSTTAGGVANTDYLDVTTAGGGPAPTEYQAENAVIGQGVVESNHAGFTGTGFVNGDNVVGSYVQFSVTGPATSLKIRFANGTATARPMDLSVDGAAPTSVNFAGTGAWTTWTEVTVPVSLAAGTHTIRLTASTANGGPNLDRITLS